MLHLWRNREEILRYTTELRRVLGPMVYRRLTRDETTAIQAIIGLIDSWARDLPDRVSFWQQVKNLWEDLWEKSD
jgi:hypothetical protein